MNLKNTFENCMVERNFFSDTERFREETLNILKTLSSSYKTYLGPFLLLLKSALNKGIA